MIRAFTCSALLLSFCYACGSSSSDSGTGNPTGGSANGASGSTSHAGSTGTAGSGSAAGGTGNSSAGSTGTGGTSALGGAGGSITGTAGTGGTTTSTGGTGTGGGPAAGGESVTQRGGDSARTAHWVEPGLTIANVAKLAMDANFKATFTGEMTGVPLFLASNPPGKGVFIAATTQNDVFALDETTGTQVWTHNIGAGKGGGPGPGIAHGGIVSTPVIDETARVIYVAAAMNSGHHEIHALSADTGMEVTGWPVDVSKVAPTLSYGIQNQRSALSLVGGTVYVGFGGYFGDGGDYHGWLISVPTNNPAGAKAWSTLGTGEGIWAPGGMASDGTGVFAITGNSKSANGNHTGSDSEEILRVVGNTPMRDDNNLFYPDIWSSGMDNGDKDFGACSPSVITVPNSTPSKIVVAPAKPGRVYFLDDAKLGGMAGQLADIVVADTGQESVYTAPSTYQTATGVNIAISTTIGSKCPNNVVANSNVMGIQMVPGSPPMPKIIWCAKVGDDDEIRRRSPISTNSNTSGADPIVWFMNGSALNAFNGDTGAPITFTPGTCGGVHRHTAPIAVNNRIVVGGDGHLCSWSVQN